MRCETQGQGSIVGSRWILSTSTNVLMTNPNIVKVGVYNFTDSKEPGERLYEVETVYNHPNASDLDDCYQLALYKLKSELVFNDHVQPVCLTRSDERLRIKNNTLAYSVGWNVYIQQNPLQYPLLQQSLANVFTFPSFPRIFLSGTEPTGFWMLPGEQLMQTQNGVWYQYGVFLTGLRGGKSLGAGYMGAYCRIAMFCDWLAATTSNEVMCDAKTGP